MTSKPQFAGERVRLTSFVSAAGKRNKGAKCTDVYSVTNSLGFVPSTEYFSKEVFSKELEAYRLVERGMLAYNPSRINVGSIALQESSDRVVVSPLYVVFSVDTRHLAPGYLLRFLKSKPGLNQIAFRSSGTVRSNLKFDALSLLEMPLPSIDVQEKRLVVLSRLEKQIETRGEFIASLDTLVKSRFVEMFKTEENYIPLEELILPGTSISYGIVQPGPDGTGDMGVLRPVDFNNGRIIHDNIKHIDPSIGSSYDRTKLTGDEMLVVVRGATGDTVLSDCSVRDMNVTRGIAVIRYDRTRVNSRYLLGYMLSDESQSYIADHTKGATLQQINMSDLRVEPVKLPSLDSQRCFARFAQQVDKLRVVAEEQKKKLQTLYDSLAQEYFAI